MKLTIAEAIKDCQFFIAFWTKNYNRKISRGTRFKEWCFYEFNYATYVFPPTHLILVTLEKDMQQRGGWCTFIQAQFANTMYYELSEIDRSVAWKKFVTDMTEVKKIGEELDSMARNENEPNKLSSVSFSFSSSISFFMNVLSV
jgi:hypothetical protein